MVYSLSFFYSLNIVIVHYNNYFSNLPSIMIQKMTIIYLDGSQDINFDLPSIFLYGCTVAKYPHNLE